MKFLIYHFYRAAPPPPVIADQNFTSAVTNLPMPLKHMKFLYIHWIYSQKNLLSLNTHQVFQMFCGKKINIPSVRAKRPYLQNLCEAIIDLTTLQNRIENRFSQFRRYCLFALNDSIFILNEALQRFGIAAASFYFRTINKYRQVIWSTNSTNGNRSVVAKLSLDASSRAREV